MRYENCAARDKASITAAVGRVSRPTMNRIEPVTSTPEPKSRPSAYSERASSIVTGTVTDAEHAGDQERPGSADPRQHVNDREDHDEDRSPQIQQAAKRP